MIPLPAPAADREAAQAAPAPTVAVLDRRKPAAPLLAARVLQFQAAVLSHDTFDAAATAFATEIASMLHFDRAAIGFSERGRTRVVATSHTADFQANAELFGAFCAAMDEALDQGATLSLPAAEGARPLVSIAHAVLGRRYGGAVCTVPLVSRGSAFGAITLARADPRTLAADELALCEHLACIVGPVLELKRESERSWHNRLLHSARAAGGKVSQPGNTVAKLGAALAACLLLALTLVPVQYRVGAEARMEGAVQRALVAPADGFIRSVGVRPGDAVTKDQVLAELDEDQLKLEHRRWQSELTQHDNAAAAALARSDRAQYVINQAKADESRAQLDLVAGQLQRSRIVAPFDGVVIKGDLTQSLGAPVRRGDVLLTIAPAHEYRLLIEVDERDIAAVRAGQQGSVALGALADHALAFHVKRITPVASARDGRNFFEVEGELDDSSPMLRPGLQGVARIDAGYEPLAWIWSHRITEWMRLALWSWGM